MPFLFFRRLTMLFPIDPSCSAAPLWRRLAAMIYDTLLVAAVSMLYGALFIFVKVQLLDITPVPGQAAAGGPLLLIGWLLTLLAFFAGFWVKKGQTLGMRSWRLQVVRWDNTPLSWRDALIRWLGAWLSALPAGLGFWWQLVDRDHLSWHDRISHSKVLLTPSQKKNP